MTPQARALKTPSSVTPTLVAGHSSTAHRLCDDDKAEVLSFLEERPLHNVVMAGFLRDNGIESHFNRGSFYATRSEDKQLDGIALIGHAMFLDARSDDSLRAFAVLAQDGKRPHMILGEQETVRLFWKLYCPGDQPAHVLCREVLFELASPIKTSDQVTNLRRAELNDLSLVMPVHAALACQESGVNPLDIDPDGFRKRCLRRIEQGRVWILAESGKLIFKADVVSETPQVNYVEGVYVNPDCRGKAYGRRCMSQMARCLLRHTQSIAVLVNEEHHQARKFFQQLGFIPMALYDTIFLTENESSNAR